MSLIDVLSPNRILLRPNCGCKEELLAIMVTRIVEGFPGSEFVDQGALLQAVLDRENQLSTGLQEGIAIPHGMIGQDIDTVGALAIIPQGLEFASMDGQPAVFILMLLFADNESGRAQHLGLLAETVESFTNAQIRRALLGAASPEDVWQGLFGPRFQ